MVVVFGMIILYYIYITYVVIPNDLHFHLFGDDYLVLVPACKTRLIHQPNTYKVCDLIPQSLVFGATWYNQEMVGG